MLINGVNDLLYWRFKLQQHGNLTHEVDRAVEREGGVLGLDADALDRVCSARGLNVDEVDTEGKREYLEEWIRVSLRLDARSVSLLLHLPILLGYNQKNRYWDEESLV